jgi:hypothetical protein
MTLEAQEPSFAAQQKLAIDGAVRRMASGATLDLYRGMLKYKRPALFRMAVDASFPGCLAKHRLIVRAMRVVTVGTFHEPFRDAMMARQCELSLNRRMAGITELRLFLAQ